MLIFNHPAFKYNVFVAASSTYPRSNIFILPFRPAPPRPLRICHQVILIAQKRQTDVRPTSDQMPILGFITSCFNNVFLSRQTRQTISQHVAHARARARGLFFFIILILYFEFIKKWSDQSDAINAGADVGLTEWPEWSDAGLTRSDVSNSRKHEG